MRNIIQRYVRAIKFLKNYHVNQFIILSALDRVVILGILVFGGVLAYISSHSFVTVGLAFVIASLVYITVAAIVIKK